MEANSEAITNCAITNLQGSKLWAGAGTGTHYRLGCPGFESWWIQNIFPPSIPVRTNPGAHRVSCKMSAKVLACAGVWRSPPTTLYRQGSV
jgi:hypothetical protein